MTLQIKSTAFMHECDIPKEYTCQGSNISPELYWNNIPVQTKSLVLIVDDPDAPDPKNPMRTWVHWVVYNISPTTKEFEKNIQTLPAGAMAGLNDWHSDKYGGPCPPIGRHRYFFKLYALRDKLPQIANMTSKRVEKEMTDLIIEKTYLIGTYQKQ